MTSVGSSAGGGGGGGAAGVGDGVDRLKKDDDMKELNTFAGLMRFAKGADKGGGTKPDAGSKINVRL